VGLPDLLGCVELVQFQGPRNVYRAAYCPATQYTSYHRRNNEAFVADTKLSPLLDDMPFAFAVLVKCPATRTGGRSWEIRSGLGYNMHVVWVSPVI
jgi:hypothetical protein